MTSGGSNKWPAGTQVTLGRVIGHRDVGYTACPGLNLYDRLPTIRTIAKAAQGGTTTTTTLVPPTRETGKLDGYGGRLLPRVSLIDESQAFGRIDVGDAILTAGGSDSLAPPDIPIGVVANVITRAGVGGIELEVELNADLDRLNFLTVILYTAPREAGGLG